MAIALRETGRAPLVIATESVPGPLWEAERNVREAGITGVTLRLGWGLDAVLPGEVEQICIAGMGGETIRRILERGSATAGRASRLILQPQSHPERVREWLLANGFGLVAEDLVEERGHFYPVTVASPGAGWSEGNQASWPPGITRAWVLKLGPVLLGERHPVLARQVARLAAERRALLVRLEDAEGTRGQLSREYLARETAELELISEWLHRSRRFSE